MEVPINVIKYGVVITCFRTLKKVVFHFSHPQTTEGREYSKLESSVKNLAHLRRVSTNLSLYGLRRLTWVETCYL